MAGNLRNLVKRDENCERTSASSSSSSEMGIEGVAMIRGFFARPREGEDVPWYSGDEVRYVACVVHFPARPSSSSSESANTILRFVRRVCTAREVVSEKVAQYCEVIIEH